MISYVNSTLEDRRRTRADRRISPIHYWGYEPLPGDCVRGHSLSRLAIRMRGLTGGLDPWVLAGVWRDLRAGFDGVYLVTQPDLLRALPWLRRRFPKAILCSWVWIAREAVEWAPYLKVCDHLFCLTPSGLDGLNSIGLGERASLQIWGCDPVSYRLVDDSPAGSDFDILMMGLSGRDPSVVMPLLSRQLFRVAMTSWTARLMGPSAANHSLVVENPNTEMDLVRLIHQSRLVWIPLYPGDPFPTGYTNLIEALLCGTGVVIADVSPIPPQVLNLPGVFLYETGSAVSLEHVTRHALSEAQHENFRETVRGAASSLLNAVALTKAVQNVFGLQGKSY